MNLPEELENLATMLDLKANASEAKAKEHTSHGETNDAKQEIKRAENGRHYAEVCRQSAEKLRKREGKTRNGFLQPTFPDVLAYIKANPETFHGWHTDDITRAFNHYESVGWTIGQRSTPMKDWKAAFRNCYMTWKEKNPHKALNGKKRPDEERPGWREFITEKRGRYYSWDHAMPHEREDFNKLQRGQSI